MNPNKRQFWTLELMHLANRIMFVAMYHSNKSILCLFKNRRAWGISNIENRKEASFHREKDIQYM